MQADKKDSTGRGLARAGSEEVTEMTVCLMLWAAELLASFSQVMRPWSILTQALSLFLKFIF